MDGIGDVLEHAGLVDIFSRNVENSEGQKLEIEWAVPTKIGLGLFFEINRDRLRLDDSLSLDDEMSKYISARERVPQALLDIVEG